MSNTVITQINKADEVVKDAIELLEGILKSDNTEARTIAIEALISCGAMMRDNKKMKQLIKDNPNLIKLNQDVK